MNMDDVSLNIDALNIELPAEFINRASAISRQVAQALADIPLSKSLTLNSLAVPAIHAHAGETDTVIARRIAQAIHTEINNTYRRGADRAAD